MGMPITVEIVGPETHDDLFALVFNYFISIDDQFSVYKKTSEISKINQGLVQEADYSKDMKLVFALSEETRELTDGYFDIHRPDGSIDPSGLVKGWSIYNAAKLLKEKGVENFFVEAGGDIAVLGKNERRESWTVGIRNPFKLDEIVKVVSLKDEGIATSGTYLRGQHIYNPFNKDQSITDIVSLTVIGPNVYEADRFATAAFAMGKAGIAFIEQLTDFEGYQIDKDGIATMTSHFERYTKSYV